jgi:hypothetical protein
MYTLEMLKSKETSPHLLSNSKGTCYVTNSSATWKSRTFLLPPSLEKGLPSTGEGGEVVTHPIWPRTAKCSQFLTYLNSTAIDSNTIHLSSFIEVTSCSPSASLSHLSNLRYTILINWISLWICCLFLKYFV